MPERPPPSIWSGPHQRGLVMWLARPLVGLLGGALAPFGVDRAHFRELMFVRLVLDLRQGGKPSAVGVTAFALNLAFFAVLGVGVGAAALSVDDTWAWIAGSQSVLMFLLALNLLSTLTVVLLDPVDLRALAPHPVPDRTLFAVRLAHLALHVALLTSGFAAGGAVLASFRQPLHAALFVYPLLCAIAAATTTGAVALLFVAFLRVVGPRRFQGVSLWVQVAGGIVLIGVMQLGPHIADFATMKGFVSAHPVLWRAFPPLQYAAIYELACGRGASGTAALLGLATPVLALAATFLLASRGFVAGLTGEFAGGARRSRAWAQGLYGLLGRWTSRSRAERAGFGFAHALARREPGFLRGALPQIVLYLLMGVSNLFRSRDEPAGAAFATGILFFSLPMMMELSHSSQHWEASWLFDALPVRRHQEVLHGAVRALLAAWTLPSVLVLLAFELALLPRSSWPLVFLTAELGLASALFIAALGEHPIPFTAAPRERSGCFQLPIMVLQFMSLGILIAVVLAVEDHPLWTRALLVGGALLLFLAYRSLRWMRLRPATRSSRLGTPEAPRP